MKKALRVIFVSIILLFIFSYNKISAQEYLPTALEDSRRVVAFYDVDGGGEIPIIEMVSQWEYRCNSDTIINDTLYKRVFKRYLRVNTYPYEPISEYILFRFIRDDIENKKVYIRSLSGGPEVLLYDFSLEVGDFVVLPITEAEVDLVTHVSSGWLFGTQTKFFEFEWPYYYMEGIGSNYGFLEPMTSLPVKKNQLDVEFTEIQNYCLSDDCESVFVSTEEIQNPKKEVVIYPQPASDFIQFTLANTETSKIIIYNLKGELIEELNGESNVEWNCKNISPGVYFYIIISKTNLKSGKIIVQ